MVSQIVTFSPLKLTGLTQYRLQAPFSLRQHGTFYLCFVFALCERKNKTQKEDEVLLRMLTFYATKASARRRPAHRQLRLN
jgi:hypothetical protein